MQNIAQGAELSKYFLPQYYIMVITYVKATNPARYANSLTQRPNSNPRPPSTSTLTPLTILLQRRAATHLSSRLRRRRLP